MLSVDIDENHRISEKKIDEVVTLMKEFAGKTTFATFDNDVIHRAIVNSLAKNVKIKFVLNVESDSESRDSKGNRDGRVIHNTNEGGRMHIHEGRTEESFSNTDIIAGPSQRSHDVEPDNGTTQQEESCAVPKKKVDALPLQSDPSSHLQQNLQAGETAERPIDIEKLLFHNKAQKLEAE